MKQTTGPWLLFVGAVLIYAQPQQYVMSTYAGRPQPPGMGIPVSVPSIATDAAGNVCLADPGNNAITILRPVTRRRAPRD
jgi:hypothetical protein